jgi:hypothetical protein
MLRLMLGGCAALAFGLVGGWTVLAVLPGKAPQNLANVEGPRQGIPDPTTADERAAVTSPSPSSAAPASPAPPLPTATKQNPGERSAAASGPMGVWIDHTGGHTGRGLKKCGFPVREPNPDLRPGV